MTLHPLYGHEALVRRLESAISAGRFPQTVLLTGPPGVGKQRLALHLAEVLLTAADDSGRAAGQVRDLVHPDLHWFVPLVPPKRSGDADKQVEEVKAALAELMVERRATSLYGPLDGAASHSVAAARLVQRIVSLTPFQGRRKVIVLGDADRLIVQESSQEAANTLLKVLEEPPADTTILVTSSAPDALLPTIRSRLVTVRVSRLPDATVAEAMATEMGTAREEATRLAPQAAGAIGRACGAVDANRDAERAAQRFLKAVVAGPTGWAGEALAQPPWGARGGFTAMLDALARALAEQARATARDRPDHPEAVRRVVRGLRLIADARVAAQGNVNPQLALAVLGADLAAAR